MRKTTLILAIALLAMVAALTTAGALFVLTLPMSSAITPTIAVAAVQPTTRPESLQTPSVPTSTPSVTPSETLEPASPVPTTPPIIIHEVQDGENLFRIATRYGLTVDALMEANAISDANLLSVGQQLEIPLAQEGIDATATADALSTAIIGAQTPDNTPNHDLGIIIPTATPAPTLPPWPEFVVGIPLQYLIIMSPETEAHIREIYAHGQVLDRNPRAFSKLGDSTIENPHFLARYDNGPYLLGEFAFLQPSIDYYHGSYSRDSIAVQRGMNSWVAFDAMWARNTACPAGVGPLECEIALHNPSVIFIRLGTNDRDPEGFEENLRHIVQVCIEQGVIPLLGTKADERAGTLGNNEIVRRVAEEYLVPLWDFERVASILPRRGLTNDNIHLETYYAHDYSASAWTVRGYAVHNLLALMALDKTRQVVTAAP